MASSLFPNQGNNLIDAIGAAKSLMSGDPQGMFQSLMQTNPQFRDFAQSMAGKTPEQMCQSCGLDYEQVVSLLKR